MPHEFKVGVIGSCLSNVPAVFLTQDYGFKRLNNVALGRSDEFVERYIEKREDLPPLERMLEALGLSIRDERNLQRHLREGYLSSGGLTELDRGLPSFSHNLAHETFDLLMLDNLVDIEGRRTIWTLDGAERRFTFPFSLIEAGHPVHQAARYDDPLTVEQSIENWVRIIDYVHAAQPGAKLVFTLTHSCTTPPDSDRARRIRGFAEAFPEAIGDRAVQIIPPLDLSPDLTMGMDDWVHFDMRVYKALAGHIYTSLVSGWTPTATSGAVRSSPKSRPSLPTWKLPPALLGVIAATLGISADAIDEASRIDATENWDSLRQVGLMASIEAAFAIQVSFEESMGANSVAAMRAVLARKGIVAADDPAGVENLFGRFVARALEMPDALYAKVLTGAQARELSHGDVLGACAALHQRLDAIPGEGIVAILLDHSEHLYTAFIGSVLKGLVPTILPPPTRKQDPAIYREGLQVLFGRVQPVAVLTTRANAGLVANLTESLVIAMDEIEAIEWSETCRCIAAPPPAVSPDTLALLQHSSGTTGHKKGVMLTHRTVMAQARLYAASIGLATGDVIASWLPLYHDMGLLTSFVIPTIVGCPIVSLDALEWVARPTLLLDVIEREKAAFAWMPNFAFNHIVRNDPGDRAWNLASMKSLISCSEPCRAASFALFDARYGAMGCGAEKLSTCYAMAETVFAISQTRPGTPPRRGVGPTAPYLSVGRPLAGVEIEIRNDGVAQLEGGLGEIFIRSETLFAGYHALPALTAERLHDGWFATRDLGLLSAGELFVIGRVDDVLIIGGRNLVAHEVEDDLNGIVGVALGRVLVAGVFDDETGSQELLVVAEPVEDGGDPVPTEAAIRERTFALCGIAPRRVRIVPKGFLVKSTSGKIARTRSLQKLREARLAL